MQSAPDTVAINSLLGDLGGNDDGNLGRSPSRWQDGHTKKRSVKSHSFSPHEIQEILLCEPCGSVECHEICEVFWGLFDAYPFWGVSECRPLLLRRRMTALPPGLRIRFKKPCTLRRFLHLRLLSIVILGKIAERLCSKTEKMSIAKSSF